LVDVIFSGYGTWWLEEDSITSGEAEKGLFTLIDIDGLVYENTGNLDMVDTLLPCDRPNSAFLKMVERGKLSKNDIGRCHFTICKSVIVLPPLEKDRYGLPIPGQEVFRHLKATRQKVDYELFAVESGKSNNIETMSELELNNMQSHEYLDPKHPMFSEELKIAIDAWNAVLKSNPDKPNKGSRKQLIEKWLDDNYPDTKHLSKSARDRITILINPDKSGGAPSSD